jgi:hypothetical protein
MWNAIVRWWYDLTRPDESFPVTPLPKSFTPLADALANQKFEDEAALKPPSEIPLPKKRALPRKKSHAWKRK